MFPAVPLLLRPSCDKTVARLSPTSSNSSSSSSSSNSNGSLLPVSFLFRMYMHPVVSYSCHADLLQGIASRQGRRRGEEPQRRSRPLETGVSFVSVRCLFCVITLVSPFCLFCVSFESLCVSFCVAFVSPLDLHWSPDVASLYGFVSCRVYIHLSRRVSVLCVP